MDSLVTSSVRAAFRLMRQRKPEFKSEAVGCRNFSQSWSCCLGLIQGLKAKVPHLQYINPFFCCFQGFFCNTEEDFNDWCQQIKKVCVSITGKGIKGIVLFPSLCTETMFSAALSILKHTKIVYETTKKSIALKFHRWYKSEIWETFIFSCSKVQTARFYPLQTESTVSTELLVLTALLLLHSCPWWEQRCPCSNWSNANHLTSPTLTSWISPQVRPHRGWAGSFGFPQMVWNCTEASSISLFCLRFDLELLGQLI